MGNDPVNKQSEEEYQFIDSEHSSDFSAPNQRSSSTSPSQMASDGKKKIFLIVGIVVAIFCLYKLAGLFSTSSTKPKSEMPAVTAKVTPAEVPKPKPAEKTEVSAPPASTDVSILQNKVGTLEQVVSKVSESNANLQYQMAGVAASIADIQNNLSGLSQQISDMSKAKEKPAEPVKAVKKAVKKSTKIAAVRKETATKHVAKAEYYVKAMIQGRAWLISGDGASATVAVGDNLPGYGVVSDIDIEKGQVSTTSGAVIEYRTSDR